jgi:predicted branched-subunit amino acid permease
MAHEESTESGDTGERLSFRSGLIEGMFGPGLGTFAAMTGFGSLAGDAGTPLWMAIALTIGVWSMPGQVAFVDLYASGASILAVALIVTVANVRMFPLTIATIPFLRKGRSVKPKHFILAQLNSVTSYVRLADAAERERDVSSRIGLFTAFTIGTFIVGTIGTILGFTLAGNLPAAGVQALVFITPLYLLLLTARSPKAQVQLSVLAGCLLVPAFSAWMGSIGILAGGLVAGSVAYIATTRRQRDA